jgi:hypothetical protein
LQKFADGDPIPLRYLVKRGRVWAPLTTLKFTDGFLADTRLLGSSAQREALFEPGPQELPVKQPFHQVVFLSLGMFITYSIVGVLLRTFLSVSVISCSMVS